MNTALDPNDGHNNHPSAENVLLAACLMFDVNLAAIRSRIRKPALVLVRRVVVGVLRRRGMSYPDIARVLDRPNHTSTFDMHRGLQEWDNTRFHAGHYAPELKPDLARKSVGTLVMELTQRASNHTMERNMSMNKYRKKPVVIEAVQFTGENRQACQDFCPHGYLAEDSFWIPTLEGTMHASVNDWIIKGVKGEFYPCKPDIFTATYEPAPDA